MEGRAELESYKRSVVDYKVLQTANENTESNVLSALTNRPVPNGMPVLWCERTEHQIMMFLLLDCKIGCKRGHLPHAFDARGRCPFLHLDNLHKM